MRKNLESLHSARSNFIKTESSERIRRALRHKTRTYSNVNYSLGDSVYYKRAGRKGWRGPARVVGLDNKVVCIRHGASFYRCHPCHLMKASSQNNDGSKGITGGHSNVGNRNTDNNESESESSDSDDEDEDNNDNGEGGENGDGEEEHDGDGGGAGGSSSPGGNSDLHEEGMDAVDDSAGSGHVPEAEPDDNNGTGDNDEGVTEDVVPSSSAVDTRTPSQASSMHDNQRRPSAHMYFQYTLKGGASGKATVLSRQPKKTGKSGNWLNVHVEGASEPSSLNWNDISMWKPLPIPEKVVLLSSIQEMSQEVVDAKCKEIRNLVENNVFDAVVDKGQKRVSTKWVITEKQRDGKKFVKARLVARGFEEKLENTRTDSPTCNRMSLRLCFAVSSTMGWQIQSFDVTSAFLQGNTIKRDVYVKPPREWEGADELIWKLKRCLYGLNDAPRAWYDRVVQLLLDFGGKASLYDAAVFLWHDRSDKLIGMTVVHVDDFVYCGTILWNKNVIDKISEVLKIGVLNVFLLDI